MPMWNLNLLDKMPFFSMCFIHLLFILQIHVGGLVHDNLQLLNIWWGTAQNRTDFLPVIHSRSKKGLGLGGGIEKAAYLSVLFQVKKSVKQRNICEMRSGIISRKPGMCLPFCVLIINHQLCTFSSSLYWSFII